MRQAAALAVLVVAAQGCVGRDVEIPTPSPATVQILSITPAPGSVITATTQIVVELKYSIEKFEPGRFKVGATAAQLEAGYSSSLVPAEGQSACVLNRATGTHKVTFDVKELWQKPEVKRPFEIVFSVDQLVGTWGVSVMAATTDPTLFFPGPHR